MIKQFFTKKRDYLLAPVYYWQAYKVAKHLIRLPEPTGIRHHQGGTPTIAIFGDSAAAGVGVDSQTDAPLGRIMHHLSSQGFHPTYHLYATSGHDSFDLLTNLYALPAHPIDIAIISIGVNDVIKRTTDNAWQYNLHHAIRLLMTKFHATDIIFLSLPPMQLATGLPKPLGGLIGRRAAALSELLRAVCRQYEQVHYVQDEFRQANLSPKLMFAKDGFHPSAITYDIWSKTLSRHVAKYLNQYSSPRPDA